MNTCAHSLRHAKNARPRIHDLFIILLSCLLAHSCPEPRNAQMVRKSAPPWGSRRRDSASPLSASFCQAFTKFVQSLFLHFLSMVGFGRSLRKVHTELSPNTSPSCTKLSINSFLFCRTKNLNDSRKIPRNNPRQAQGSPRQAQDVPRTAQSKPKMARQDKPKIDKCDFSDKSQNPG